MKRKFIYTLFSLLFAGAVFSYLFNHITLTEVFQIASEIDLRLLLIFICLSFFMNFLRVWRYQLLLKQSDININSFSLFLVVLIRNVFSDLLPARIGTAIYVYIVNSRLGVKFGAASSSFALAFLFDILAMPPLILLAILSFNNDYFDSGKLIIASCILFLLTSIIIYYLPSLFKLSEKKIKFLKSIRIELDKYKNNLLYLKLFLVSLLIRISKYFALYVFLIAILIPLGYRVADVSLVKAFLGMTAAEAAASLPVGNIGGFGAYEGTWALTFNMLGFSEKIASLTAVVHHLFTQLYGYGLGILGAILLLLPLRKFSNLIKIPAGLFIPKIIISAGVLFFFYVVVQNLPTETPKNKNTSITSSEIELNNTIPKLKIIFDSNRSGSFGIYMLDTEEQKITLVEDQHFHEMYPDIFKDQIVFAKHETKSRFESGEIWLIKDNKKSRIIKNGTFPTFSSDGLRIYYEKERKSLWEYNLKTQKKKRLFPKGKKKFAVVKPRVSPDGKKVAFTGDIDGRWHAYIADIKTGKIDLIYHGCEPDWLNNKELAFIKQKNVQAGSGIYSFRKDTQNIIKLEDQGAPFGHEYFPSYGDAGKLLAFSACPADQHDHLNANYQIFVKNLETQEVHQITNDAFTNRWPKIAK